MKRSQENSNECKKAKIIDQPYLNFKNSRTTFESFISTDGITIDSFLNEYWDKKPLLIKRSDEKWLNYVKSLFSLDFLKSILENNSKKIKYENDLNLCKLVNGEKKVFNKKGLAKFKHVIDTFENEKATIQFHQPQRFSDELWNLSEKFESFFGNLVGSNIYITPNDSQGFPAHHDDINAFVIQIEGKKHWLVYEPIMELPNDYRLTDKKDLKEPILDIILEPGDILFFPRGFIHQANSPKQDDKNESNSCPYSTHVTISTYQNFNKMEYITSVINSAIRNQFLKNLDLRQGLPIGFFRQNNFDEYLKNSLEKIKFDAQDCYPIDLIKDFMSSRLPPFLDEDESSLNSDECSISALGHIQSLNENLLIKLSHPEHVYVAIENESAEFESDDEESNENEHQSDKNKTNNTLLIFYSISNLRENHMMMSKESDDQGGSCLKSDVRCLNLMKTLIDDKEDRWFSLKSLKEKIQDFEEDGKKLDEVLKTLLVSLAIEKLIKIKI